MAFTLAEDLTVGPEEVGIAITHGALGTHLGLAYCDENGSARLLHLGWHKRLFVDEYPQPTWLACIMPMTPFASSQAVALIRGMADRYGNRSVADSVDYGINLFAGRDAIRGDGQYFPGPDCDGFTCASLIAEILKQVGFHLVDLKTWPAAPKNEAWGRAIVCMLKATSTPDDHVKKVEKNITGLRLRPEEVAAAAELSPTSRPATHTVLQVRADQIFSQVLEACGPPPPAHPAFEHCVTTYREQLELLTERENSSPES
jgi:hypothetical protein